MENVKRGHSLELMDGEVKFNSLQRYFIIMLWSFILTVSSSLLFNELF